MDRSPRAVEAGRRRLEADGDGLFYWAVVALSRSDDARLRALHVRYMRSLRQLVDASDPSEVVAVANVQLFTYLHPARWGTRRTSFRTPALEPVDPRAAAAQTAPMRRATNVDGAAPSSPHRSARWRLVWSLALALHGCDGCGGRTADPPGPSGSLGPASARSAPTTSGEWVRGIGDPESGAGRHALDLGPSGETCVLVDARGHLDLADAEVVGESGDGFDSLLLRMDPLPGDGHHPGVRNLPRDGDLRRALRARRASPAVSEPARDRADRADPAPGVRRSPIRPA